ncbi:MAG TPA: hypothetical protein VFX68_04915 [Sulfuricurvum sp.]|nr:hypothetical protein [Sulfuricurvum sp.]
MEAMYNLGLEIHIVGVLVLMGVVMFNILMLTLSKHLIAYAKRMRIVMPISASLIFLVLFTGAIMMAAKHLQFTFMNIAMIMGVIVMIVLETKRYKTLKYHTNIQEENALGKYKQKAFRYLGLEMAILISLSVWMMR